MKKLLLPWVLLALVLLFMSAIPLKDCHCKGIPLHGRVQIVPVGADFEVKVEETFADLDVDSVAYFPRACGEWQFVDHAADFTIHYVPVGEDFSIRFVEHFPGQTSHARTMP